MLNYFASTSPESSIFSYLFTQGVLGVVCVGLIIIMVYLVKKLDKKEVEIKDLNRQLLDENKAHTIDYREMAKDNQEVLQGNSQSNLILAEKIEIVKGRQ